MKRKIELAMGGTIEGPKEHIDFIEKRDRFIKAYSEEKGWDLENLSFEQIIEIRQQEGWVTPE